MSERRPDNSERFHRLFWPLRDVVLRAALVLSRDASEADDLAQETMLKAYRQAHQFTDGTDARAWLLAILRNARIDRLRSAARRGAPLSLDALEHDPAAEVDGFVDLEGAPPDDPDALLEQFSDAEVIDALRALPEEIRWTLLLVDVHELDHAAAGGLLGVPVGTIKSRAHRGRSMLRRALSARAAGGAR